MVHNLCTRISVVLASISSLAFVGCAKISAEDIKQDAWRAQYSVETKSGRIRCVASYRAGGSTGTFIELKENEDQVFCQNKKMQKIDSAINEAYYETTIDMPTNEKVFIELKRKEGNFLAEVTMAKPFEISGFASPLLSKGYAFNRTWAANPDSRIRITMQYQAGTDVRYIDRFQTTDQGQVRFEGSETPHTGTLGNIPATITYTRFKIGSMPQGLKGNIESVSSTTESVTFQ